MEAKRVGSQGTNYHLVKSRLGKRKIPVGMRFHYAMNLHFSRKRAFPRLKKYNREEILKPEPYDQTEIEDKPKENELRQQNKMFHAFHISQVNVRLCFNRTEFSHTYLEVCYTLR